MWCFIKYSKDDIIEIIFERGLDLGVNNITIDAFLEIIPISRRTLYRMFTTKDQLLFEIYKKASTALTKKISKTQPIPVYEKRHEAIQENIKGMINTFIEYERYTIFIVEFDSYVKMDEAVIEMYNQFYSQLDYMYLFLDRIYIDERYSKELLYQMSFLVLETCLGLVYRYLSAVRSNYQARIDSKIVTDISYGLMSIIKSYEDIADL